MRLRALRRGHLRRSAVMLLPAPFSSQRRLLTKNVFIFRVSLREVRQPKPLLHLQFARALAVTLDHLLDAPLDFRRRKLPPAAEELIVLNLQLADVSLHSAQFFVNRRGHKSWTGSFQFIVETASV